MAEIPGAVLKIIGVALQYGMLFLLLYFVFKLVRFMLKDSKPLREEIYHKPEITTQEAIITIVDSSNGAAIGHRFAFSDELTIGRDTSNDIIINDSYVSRHQAVIRVMNNLYAIEDMGSVIKSLVNSHPLEGRRYLQTGDIIAIGSTVLRFER